MKSIHVCSLILIFQILPAACLYAFVSDRDIAGKAEAEEFSRDLAEELMELYEDPVDLNRAGLTELSSLPGIDVEDARGIIKSRQREGPFLRVEDLVHRGIMTLNKLKKIRLFVAVRDPAGNESGGTIYHETVAEAGSGRDRTRVKLERVGDRFFIGGVFLNETRNVSNIAARGSALSVSEVKRVRWDKGYVFYDALETRGGKSRGSSGLLKQMVVGNYRAGFLEGTAKQRAVGFLGDDRLSPAGGIRLDGARKTAVPLKGAAAMVGTKWWGFSAFFSRDRYPASFPSVKTDPDSDSGELSVSSATVVEDIMIMKSSGFIIGTTRDAGSHFGLFMIWNQADLDVPPLARTSLYRNSLWGIQRAGTIRHVGYRLIYSRMDRSLPGGQGRNFLFLRTEAEFGDWTDLIFSYKRLESGYFNPTGSVFSGDYLWKTGLRATRRFGRDLRLRLDWIQVRRKLSRSRTMAYRLSWNFPYQTGFEFGQTFLDRDTVSSNSSPDSRRLRSTVGIIHRPSRKIRSRLDLEIETERRSGRDGLRTGEVITYRIRYDLAALVGLAGKLRYSDSDVDRTDTESRSVHGELRLGPLRGFRATIRWENTVRSASRKVYIDGLEEEVPSSTSREKLTFRLLYSW